MGPALSGGLQALVHKKIQCIKQLELEGRVAWWYEPLFYVLLSPSLCLTPSITNGSLLLIFSSFYSHSPVVYIQYNQHILMCRYSYSHNRTDSRVFLVIILFSRKYSGTKVVLGTGFCGNNQQPLLAR